MSVSKQQLKDDVKQSMKDKDTVKRGVLSMLLTAIQNKELEKRGKLSETIKDTEQLEKDSQLDEQEIMAVIGSEAKKRKDSIAQFTEGGRDDLVANEQAELEVLTGYLPAQLDEAAVEAAVKEVIAEVGASSMQDMGKVMGAAMKKLQGQADGNAVQGAVKKLLS